MATVGTLNEAALKRRERLKNLREKHNKTDEDNETEEDAPVEKEKLPRPTFRSYKPEHDILKEQVKPSAKPSDITASIKDQIESGKTDHVISEVDLEKLAPRKPDWDLKRDVSKKLDKLERRTQRAIAELIRERLKASQEDFASMVTVGAEQYRVEAAEED